MYTNKHFYYANLSKRNSSYKKSVISKTVVYNADDNNVNTKWYQIVWKWNY